MTTTEEVPYVLTLYISGASPSSARAVTHVHALCEQHLANRHLLAIVDALVHPGLVIAAGVVAVPTLVRDAPLPRVRIVGDLADTPAVLRVLGLPDPVLADGVP